MTLTQISLLDFLSKKTTKPTIVFEAASEPGPIKTETGLQRMLDLVCEDDPNYKLFEMLEAGTLTRDIALREYKPLGLTANLENSRGLPDMHKKRELNMGQFFTPAPVVEALTQAMGLDRAKNLTIMDNSMGIGSMFQFVPEGNRLYGIELDEKAYSIAKHIWPDATVINDNLINHPLLKYDKNDIVEDYRRLSSKHVPKADAFIINPPFSLQLEKKNMPLANAKWGKLGPASSIESHLAALEIALSGSRLVTGAIVPTSFFTNASTYAFEKWASYHYRKLLRIDLPAEAFKEYGTEWNCSLVVYVPNNSYRYKSGETVHLTAESMSHLPSVLEQWKASPNYGPLIGEIENSNTNRSWNLDLQVCEEEDKISVPDQPQLPLEYTKEVRIAVNANSSGITFSPKDMLSALKFQEGKDAYSYSYVKGLNEKVSQWDWNCRRMNLINEGISAIEAMKETLANKGLDVKLDQQVINWHQKNKRRYELEMTPYEKAVYDEDRGVWINKYSENGIRTKYAHRYAELNKRLDKLGIDWLWPFQRDDVIRLCMKSASMYSGAMGVGKTRIIIASILLSGHKHSLIVVESRNVKEFLNEFKNLNIDDVNVIKSRKDVENLKQFNIISYNKLWRELDKNTTKKFIHVLKKKAKFVAFDEAHNLKAKDSKQARAARTMFGRAKRIIEATGTLINNYPRNIFSLLVAGWGDGTELNPYGYYYPAAENRWNFTTGTRKFSEMYVMTEWYSEQFAQTLDKGMKSMEVPMVKDIESWNQMLAPKMIRRTVAEPDVLPYMKCPTPTFHHHMIKPDDEHLLYYKKWLEEFAHWFEKQLELMKIDSTHNINTAIVLAHLTKLQFAATVPQSSKTDIKNFEWSHGTTAKQEKTIELVKEAISNNEKVIVFSERPEFLSFMKDTLENENIESILFTGQQTIEKRIMDKEKFQTSEEINVMLATTICGETGLNIPEASVVIMADLNWTPSKTRQAYSRILRPQQKKEPHIHYVLMEGMIDQYMKQLCDLKADGIDQAIDEKNVEEFDPESWMSYKDFSYKMLQEEGFL